MKSTVWLLFTFIIAVLSSNIAFAQQEFLIQGVVFEKGTKLRVALAEITNKRSAAKSGSNDLGIFSIRVKMNDTLLVSKRNYNDAVLMVTSTKDLLVYLNKGTMLNEVVIVGQSKKQSLDELKRDFRDKGSFHGGKPPLLSFLFTPLTALYDLFGKTPRQDRRLGRMYQTEIQDLQVDQFFNKTVINQQTGLSGKELEDFLVNYRPTYEQAKHWTTYDGMKWINDSYKSYRNTKPLKTTAQPN